MTEIVAAHLERVARELAEQVGAAHKWHSSPCTGCEKNIAVLAAALAACARERDRSNREYYKEVLNKAGRMQAAWVIHETPILSEAERAVGEKGAGEHD